MSGHAFLDMSEEEALKYPMRYTFPELGEHWDNKTRNTTFVEMSRYDKLYSRYKDLQRDKLEILGHFSGLQDVIKNLENQIKELKGKCQ